MRQPTLLFLPASQETCHSCAGRPVLSLALDPTTLLRRRIPRSELCNVTGAGAHGNPAAETFPGMLWTANGLAIFCRFRSIFTNISDGAQSRRPE
jgi:hypothetical protein